MRKTAQPKWSMAQADIWVVSWELTHHQGYSNVWNKIVMVLLVLFSNSSSVMCNFISIRKTLYKWIKEITFYVHSDFLNQCFIKYSSCASCLDGFSYSYYYQNLSKAQVEISLLENLLRSDRESLLDQTLTQYLWALFSTWPQPWFMKTWTKYQSSCQQVKGTWLTWS